MHCNSRCIKCFLITATARRQFTCKSMVVSVDTERERERERERESVRERDYIHMYYCNIYLHAYHCNIYIHTNHCNSNIYIQITATVSRQFVSRDICIYTYIVIYMYICVYIFQYICTYILL